MLENIDFCTLPLKHSVDFGAEENGPFLSGAGREGEEVEF